MNRLATFNNKTLAARNASIRGYRIDALLALAMAVPVAVVSATSVNAVVTFAIGSGTPTSGSTQYLWYGKTLIVNWNETAATLTAKLRDILGVGNFTVAGGPLPGTGLTVTLNGNFAGRTAQTPAQVGTTTLSAGTPSATVTTLAVPKDRIVAWNPAKLAAPTAALVTYSGAGTGTWIAGTYIVQHTWETAAGESAPSPIKTQALTLNQALRVAAINAANTPDEAVALNVYVNGARVARIAVTTPGTAGNVVQTDIADANGATGADGKGVPDFNRAYLFADGRQNFLGFTKSAIETDAFGNLKTQFAGKLGLDQVEILIGGTFQQSELAFVVGTISEFVAQVQPRITSGSIATGDAELSFGPSGDDAR